MPESAETTALQEATSAAVTIDSLAIDGRYLIVHWADGHSSRFHAFWLRDNCPTGAAMVENCSQRLLDAVDLPDDLAPNSVRLNGMGQVEVVWQPDGIVDRFQPVWLRSFCGSPVERDRRRRRVQTWDARVNGDLPAVDFTQLQDDETLFDLLDGLVRLGIGLVKGVPRREGTVIEVADRIGFIRETNYGRIFDVKVKDQHYHFADTSMGLEVHTDNPYRDPAPGIQLLHCLQSSGIGGESVLVDGFRVAETLREQDPDAFQVLTTLPRSYRYADNESDLRNRALTIEVDFDGELQGIHYNNRSAAVPDLPEQQVEPFYRAYRAFGKLLKQTEFRLHLKLAPGDLIVFDNRRLLHGRTEFDNRTTVRHLQGCYVETDEAFSRWRKLAETTSDDVDMKLVF